jgi:hypothetical protein
VSTALSEAERARRRQFVIDGKAASALGISMEAYPMRGTKPRSKAGPRRFVRAWMNAASTILLKFCRSF